MNFHRLEDDYGKKKNYQDDHFINKHLQQIRLRTAQYKALREKKSYINILEQIKRLREIGFEKVKQLLNPQEAMQLQPLFSKFQELSENDEGSIAEDKELLQLLTGLKDKLDNAAIDE